MRLFTFFICMGVLSCSGSPSNNLPRPKSTRSATKDNTVAQIPAPEKDTTKLGGQWFLLPVLPSDTVTGRIPRLVFDLAAKRFTGNTGCNSMSGQFAMTGSVLQFNRHIITTKMACVGYNEKEFLENLLRTNGYTLQHDTLFLLFNQTVLSRWTRKITPKPKVNKA